MAVPSRPAMRLLSARLRCLSRPSSCGPSFLRSARSSSRYSRPGTRPAAAAIPSEFPAFTDVAKDSVVEEAHSGRAAVASDAAAAQREYEAVRAHHLRRMRFAGIGLLLSVTGLAATVYNLDLDDIEKGSKKNKVLLDAGPGSQEQFQGRDVHIIGAGEDKRIIAEGKEETELVQTGSGSVPYFPRRMYLPLSGTTSSDSGNAPSTALSPADLQNNEEYTLVGLGIRTVSFLSIEVYVMGMYVRTRDLSAMQARFIHLINSEASTLVPTEKEQLKQRLLDPVSSVEVWEQLLREEEGIKSAWRVVPSKNTDFAHLRDGWMNGIKRATQEVATAKKSQSPAAAVISSSSSSSEYEDETFGAAVKSFKDLFHGGGRAPKGSVVLLLRDAAGSLEVLFNDPRKNQNVESVGKVSDPRIGRLIWMGYLAGKNVSSEPARKAVVDGCVGLAARPVGTVETMVQ